MAISFEAIGERMVTFAAGTGLKEGKVCKMTANGTVGACGENDIFIGVVSSVRGVPKAWRHEGTVRGHDGKQDPRELPHGKAAAG